MATWIAPDGGCLGATQTGAGRPHGPPVPVRAVARFLAAEDGFAISTEAVLWLTLLGISITVGLVAVRWALLDVFVDSAEALATRESGFPFDPSDPRLYYQMPDPSYFDENPDVGTEAGDVIAIPAQPEGP